MERVIVIKKEIARHTRDFGEDTLQVLTARYDLAYALWKGGQYAAAADHTARLICDCVRRR